MAVPLLAAADRPEALTLDPPAAAPLAVRTGVLYERAAALETLERYAEARAVLRGVARDLPGVLTDDMFVADMFRLHLADGDYSEAFADGSPLASAEIAQDLFERLSFRGDAARSGERRWHRPSCRAARTAVPYAPRTALGRLSRAL